MLTVNNLIGFGVGSEPLKLVALYGNADTVDGNTHTFTSVPLDGMATIILQAGCDANGGRSVDFVSATVDGVAMTERVKALENEREYNAGSAIFTFDNRPYGKTSATIVITTSGSPRTTYISVLGVNKAVGVPTHSATDITTPLGATLNVYSNSFSVANCTGYNTGAGITWNVLTEYYENLAETYFGSYAKQENTVDGSVTFNITANGSFGCALTAATWLFS